MIALNHTTKNNSRFFSRKLRNFFHSCYISGYEYDEKKQSQLTTCYFQ